MKRLAGFALCLLAIGAGSTLAQGRSASYSTWIVSGNRVTLRFLLPVTEARRLMGTDVPVLTVQKLEDYMLKRLTVQSVAGDCPAIDQGYDLGRVDPLAVGPDFYGFEIFYRCADPRRLVLQNTALFDRVPAHINFARIRLQGRSVDQLFTAARQRLRIPDDGPLPSAGFWTYLRLGCMHILNSADRVCFLLGSVLLARRTRDIGYLVPALALGYLLSLGASSEDWVLPRMTLVEAFVGLLVALLGAAMTLRETQRRRLATVVWPALLLLLAVVAALARAPWAALMLSGGAAFSAGFLVLSGRPDGRWILWPLLATLFAFLDGFVLPSMLRPAQLPQWVEARVLIGFDLGAVLLDTALVGLLLGAFLLMRARDFAARPPLVNDLCAASLGGCGAFWMLSRLWT
ncbi:MAG: HupE/UreJ family protein [Steroidobacteraceae bacterium]